MRILAGEFKGRRLLSPPRGSEARPITGLAKKSLFDTLGGRLVDATVADLYCGTGTLGLEALSRGAARCCFADRDRATVARLRKNIAALRVAERCVVWAGDVATRLQGWLEAMDGEVDVAFVDPPYAQTRRWDWRAIADRIFVPLARRLAPDGRVVLRTQPKLELPERIGPLAVVRTRRHGGTLVAFLAPAEEAE